VTLYQIVTKLIGPIQPMGDSAMDSMRLENIKVMTELVAELLAGIERAAKDYNRGEDSMVKISKHAREFLVGIKEYTLLS
jgi:hypothetical protein